MNTSNIKVGQVWEVKTNSIRKWRAERITVTYIGNDYFTYKEDPEQKSWHFSLLNDHYDLVSGKE